MQTDEVSPYRQAPSGLKPKGRLASPDSPKQAAAVPYSEAQKRLLVGGAIILVPLIFLQKFAIPLAGQQISFVIPAFLVGTLYLLTSASARVDVLRAILFTAFAVVAILSQLASGVTFSPLSVGIVLVLFAPFIFVWRLPEEDYKVVLDLFQNLMIVPSLMVFVQIAYQVLSGWRTLSLNDFVPAQFLMQGFIYEAPLHWGGQFFRPNGFFMLEPSYISMFVAAALVIEAAGQRRLWRLGLYGASLAATMGGTGFVLLALSAPFIFVRLEPWIKIAALIAVFVALAAGVASGALDPVFGRFNELGHEGSSGYGRLVQPFDELAQAARGDNVLFKGVGAGNIVTASSTWPITKLAVEYGFIASAAFFILELAFTFGAPIPGVAFALFVIFNFTGGYLPGPVPTALIFYLVGAFRPEGRGAYRSPRRERPSAAAARA